MRKLQVLIEAMEKAKEKYWKEGKCVCVAVELWKHSSGQEKINIRLWVDEDAKSINGKGEHIFSSESFDELLIFLNGESSGDAKFTTFGGAPPSNSQLELPFGENPNG